MKLDSKALLAALAASFSLALSASAMPIIGQSHSYGGTSLSKIGKSIAYPIKKAAGNGSKVANHGAKAVEYPVRKAGVNTSKTAHKTVGKS